MKWFYRIAYAIGKKPWEEMAVRPIGGQITSLFDRVEDGRTAPFGPAIDVGCGTGIWSVRLASRGWQVTGVDLVAKAVRAARRRVRDEGVEARIVRGDLTRLRSAGVGTGFQFVLDLGAIHGLSEVQRRAAAREIGAVAAPGVTLITFAWLPGRRGPLPRGMSREEIRDAFEDWTIVDEELAEVAGAPGYIEKAEPRFYTLQRR